MKMNWKKKSLYLAMLAVCMLMVLTVSGCGSGKQSSTSKDTKIEKGNTDFEAVGLRVDREAILSEGRDPYIGGTVVNTTDGNLHVKMTFALYDSEGKIVGKAVTEHNSLEPGVPYYYSARCSLHEDEFESFELMDVTTEPAKEE